VETDEERRTANASDKEVSVEHDQGTPEAAPHAITTMVNYMGAAGIETEGGKRTLHQLITRLLRRYPKDNPKMHKAFPRQEVLISKGERFTNFLLPQSVSGSTKFLKAQDI